MIILENSYHTHKLKEILVTSKHPREDAENYCVQAVDKGAAFEECMELLLLIEDINIPYAQYKLYKRMGDSLLLSQKFEEAYINYMIALDISNDNNLKKEKIFLYNNMGIAKLKILQYDEAIYYLNSCLILSNNMKFYQVYNKALYNLALAYISIFKVEDSLVAINKCYKRIDKNIEKQLYIKLKILEINCYDYKNQLEKCAENYSLLLKEEEDIEKALLGNIYNNIAGMHLKKKDYEESSVYFKKAYEIRSIYDKEFVSHTIIDESKLYYELGNLECFYNNIFHGIELCKKHNDYEYWILALMELEKVYKKDNNVENLRDIYKEILGIAEKNKLRKELMYALNSLIRLEIKEKNFQEAYKYNERLNKYIENIVNI